MQVTGIAYIRVNGATLRTKEGAKLNPGGKERTSVVGHAVYGYAEKVVPSSIECTIAHTADISLREIADWAEVTVEFETDTGRTFVVNGAWVTEPPELTAGEGDVSLNFEGPPAVES